MRILQINKFYYAKGGAETYLFALLELLKRKNQEVICFSQKHERNLPCAEENSFIDDLDLSKLSLPSLLKLPRIFWSFKARRLVRRLIKDKRPDIVHIHNIYHQISPSILPLFRQAGIPVVMTVHDFKLITPNYNLRADGNAFKHQGSILKSLLLRLEFAWHKKLDIYARNIDLFIAPSEFVKAKLAENGFNPDKIEVIPHFLPPEFSRLLPKSIKPSAKSEDYILSYGRLDEGKGFDDLIKAFAEINLAGLKLKIAGAGPDETRLKSLIRDSGLQKKVKLLGAKDKQDLIELIRGAKAIVNCSKLHETFGLTVLEAMALGKPVIASKVGAIPELIRDGENGLLYQVADAGDLKKQLLRLLSDDKLRKKISAAGRKTAAGFTAAKHYKLLLAAYARAGKNFKRPIRLVSDSLINLAAFFVFTSLLLVPFYRIKIENGLALSAFQPSFPRTANLYWINPVALADAAALAQWDLLALDMQAQSNSAATIKEIRRLNPEIIILAYTTANEMPTSRLKDVEPSGSGLWHDLASGDKSDWHLKTVRGADVIFWPGNVMMNLGAADSEGRTYADYLVDFYDQKIMSSGLWDGLLFDNAWQTVAQVDRQIDIDGDKKSDSADKINSRWQADHLNFFSQLRQRLGSRAILIGNGDGAYESQLNGRMFEGFPEYWEGGWEGSIKRYKKANKVGFQPRINIVNTDTDNTGNSADYRAMRFGLMSTLLFDGFYSFDYGTMLREQLWWYDEFDSSLGRPLGTAINTLSSSTEIKNGLWQREFSGGLVLVNSTEVKQTIILPTAYRKILGIQDAFVNNGEIIKKITLPAQDGIILLNLASEQKAKAISSSALNN